MSTAVLLAEPSIGGHAPQSRSALSIARIGDFLSGFVAIAKATRSLSFGQYAEDVMMATSLLPRSKGFYVDVGAYHPCSGSNTYKLYLRGWSGMTIEPNPAAEPLFRRWRKRDKHLVVGVAPSEGDLTYYEFRDPKRNSFSKEQADIYVAENDPLIGQRSVPCRPLQAILDENAPGQTIDLLSVDCEGFDLLTLTTLDFARSCPTAILVEDFEGFQLRRNSSGRSAIEALLVGKGYEFIGQNLFSSLFVDGAVIHGERPSDAFNCHAWQFR